VEAICVFRILSGVFAGRARNTRWAAQREDKTMKRHTRYAATGTVAIFALCSIICPARSRGQETNNNKETKTAVIEPEYADVFFRLDAGKLIPLERQATNNTSVKGSGFMVAHAKSVWEFAGAKSPVRFGGGKLEFIVRTSAATPIDPQGQYSLQFLAVKKKVRQMIGPSARASAFGGMSIDRNGQGIIPVNFERYGSSSVKMTVGSLPPGEYALSSVQNPLSAFCFGVDE
jgi:hypothetical protein